MNEISLRKGLFAISPIAVFLCFYLIVSLVVGDFYKMPLAVALVAASAWGVFVNRPTPLIKCIEIFSRHAGSSNVMYMIWIFVLAGAFATLAKQIGSVEATVNFALTLFPASMLVPGLFVAACFISIAIGTSVGTIVALVPLAVQIALSESESIPFFVAVVIGGAFFGDNLSFISDTTIAATRTQGCKMSDKFRTNLWIALPAAVAALILYIILGTKVPDTHISDTINYWLVVPYVLIIVTALSGMNVTLVLSLGIAATFIIGVMNGFPVMDLFGYMGEGIDSMGNLIIITLLAAGMLGLIKAAGGINYIINLLTRRVKGPRGAQGSIALLVSLVNLCTANNTVAILTVGELSKDISLKFHLDPRKTASILDTSSCIVQSLIPYGAQTLFATSLAGISPVAPWGYMYYPWMLLIMVALSIIFRFPRIKY